MFLPLLVVGESLAAIDDPHLEFSVRHMTQVDKHGSSDHHYPTLNGIRGGELTGSLDQSGHRPLRPLGLSGILRTLHGYTVYFADELLPGLLRRGGLHLLLHDTVFGLDGLDALLLPGLLLAKQLQSSNNSREAFSIN